MRFDDSRPKDKGDREYIAAIEVAEPIPKGSFNQICTEIQKHAPGKSLFFNQGGGCPTALLFAQRLYYLKHFLRALGLSLKNAGPRAGTLNMLLRQSGKTGRLVERKLKSKSGHKPWVAPEDTFRDIYQCL